MEGHTDMLYMYRMLNAECTRTGLCTPCLVGFFFFFFFDVLYLGFPK